MSHDRSAIQSICDTAILLENGRLAMRGKPEEVMDYYNAMLAQREGQIVRQGNARQRPGANHFRYR